MGSVDLITEVTLTDGTTVRTTTKPAAHDDPWSDYYVAIDTPSTEQPFCFPGYLDKEMQALVHRAVVRALIEEDKHDN